MNRAVSARLMWAFPSSPGNSCTSRKAISIYVSASKPLAPTHSEISDITFTPWVLTLAFCTAQNSR